MEKLKLIDCYDWLQHNTLPKTVDLIYIDPPFNTGNTQQIHGVTYEDNTENFLGWLVNRLYLMRLALKDTGSILVHLDWREVHYVKVAMDAMFGRNQFKNEIIWAYDYGGRPSRNWPRKHDTILWYTKTDNYTFNKDATDKIPYLAPGLVPADKTERGKIPTDVMWNTIVPTNSKERVGYPTQKPLSLLERLVLVHSNPGDLVADYFCGSGTTLVAAKKNNRNFFGTDISSTAIEVSLKRLGEIA